jgi:hypothetical protein
VKDGQLLTAVDLAMPIAKSARPSILTNAVPAQAGRKLIT